MKKQRLLALAFSLALLGAAGPLWSADTRVSSVSGSDEATLAVGRAGGVRVGMTGRISTQEKIGGKTVTIEVASFRVESVTERSSRVRLTSVGQGWTVEPGMSTEFDQRLLPPPPPQASAPKPTPPKPASPVEPANPVDVLRQAEAAYKAEDWTRAERLYVRFLDAMPGAPDPHASDRLKSVRDELRQEDERRRAAEAARLEQQRLAEERAVERARVPVYEVTLQASLDDGNLERALDYAEKILAVDPENEQAREVKATWEETRAKSRDEARQRLVKVMEQTELPPRESPYAPSSSKTNLLKMEIGRYKSLVPPDDDLLRRARKRLRILQKDGLRARVVVLVKSTHAVQLRIGSQSQAFGRTQAVDVLLPHSARPITMDYRVAEFRRQQTRTAWKSIDLGDLPGSETCVVIDASDSVSSVRVFKRTGRVCMWDRESSIMKVPIELEETERVP